MVLKGLTIFVVLPECMCEVRESGNGLNKKYGSKMCLLVPTLDSLALRSHRC